MISTRRNSYTLNTSKGPHVTEDMVNGTLFLAYETEATTKNKTDRPAIGSPPLENETAGGTTGKGAKGTETQYITLKSEQEEPEGTVTHRPTSNHPKAPDEGTDEVICLQRRLGLLEAIAVIIGIVIGSGIFVSPSGVIFYTGSVGLALLIWPITGIMSTVGALCFAELGTMFPESGGTYTYLTESLGPLPAFLCGWITVMVRNCSGIAIVSLTFSSYLVQALLPSCDGAPYLPVTLIALLIIIFDSWVNCVNVTWAVKVQKIFTASKVIALFVIIATGAKHLAEGHTQNYQHPFRDSNWSAAAISAACYQSLFAYSGWEEISHVVEELKDQKRDLPRAIFISMLIITFIYLLTNAAYLAVLTPDEMITSEAVALTFATRTLNMMAWTMPVFIMCSTFGSMNGTVLSRSRLLYVLARRGQFPKALSLLHVDKATPVPAIVFNCFLSLMMVMTSKIRRLMTQITFAMTLSSLGCVLGLLWLRYTQPHRERPYKVSLVVPVLYVAVQVFLLVVPLIYDPLSVGISLAFISTGLPIYYLFIYRQDLAEKCSGPMGKLAYFSELLFMSLPGEKVD